MLKRSFVKKVTVAAIIFAAVLYIIFRVPVFTVVEQSNADKLLLESDKTVCILEYTYTTGSGWFITDSNDKSLINKEVILCSRLNPRLLKANAEYDLDYMAKYVMTVDTMWDTTTEDGEIMPVVRADTIGIVYPSDKTYYSIADMQFFGIAKAFLGLFNKRCMFHY